jgi:hypothetical protein
MDMEPAVRDYLEALDDAAAALDPDRRTDLVAEVREHIDLALIEAGSTDEATVHGILERLGAPAEIVAAETGATEAPVDSTTVAGSIDRPRLALTPEQRTLLVLLLGSIVLPFVGPILGLWMMAGSERWTLTQKRTAALIVVTLLVLPAVVLIPAAIAGEWMWVIGTGGLALPFVPLAGIVAGLYLIASSSFVLTVSRRT